MQRGPSGRVGDMKGVKEGIRGGQDVMSRLKKQAYMLSSARDYGDEKQKGKQTSTSLTISTFSPSIKPATVPSTNRSPPSTNAKLTPSQNLISPVGETASTPGSLPDGCLTRWARLSVIGAEGGRGKG